MGKKLFDYVIGNPPYQEEQDSEDIKGSKKNYAPPVYNIFMDEANKIADRVEFIRLVFCLMLAVLRSLGMKKCSMMNILRF